MTCRAQLRQFHGELEGFLSLLGMGSSGRFVTRFAGFSGRVDILLFQQLNVTLRIHAAFFSQRIAQQGHEENGSQNDCDSIHPPKLSHTFYPTLRT
jgi:hypothetical protein